MDYLKWIYSSISFGIKDCFSLYLRWKQLINKTDSYEISKRMFFDLLSSDSLGFEEYLYYLNCK